MWSMQHVKRRAADFSSRLLVTVIVGALGISRLARADSPDASKTVTLTVSGECPSKDALATELQRAHFAIMTDGALDAALPLEVVDEGVGFRVSLDGSAHTDSGRLCEMRARAVTDFAEEAERKRFVRKVDGGLAVLVPMHGAGYPA
jgi:hypothetical protein